MWDDRYDDVDRIESILLQDVHHRAAKEHPCSAGRHAIKPGEVYRRRRMIVDGEPCTEKLCQKCEAEEYGYYE